MEEIQRKALSKKEIFIKHGLPIPEEYNGKEDLVDLFTNMIGKLGTRKGVLTKKLNKMEDSPEKEELQREREDLEIESKIITLRRNELIKTAEGLKIKKGGNVTFYNDPQELLKKLELIVGSIIAGNTNIEMYNIGIAILDILLKTKVINKSQHEKIYKNYFKQ